MTTDKFSSMDLDLVKIVATRNAFLPLEHVLERLKLESQKHPEQSAIKTTQALWRQRGLQGLYSGFKANFVRRVTRDFYQMPLTVVFNRFWQSHLPEKYNQNAIGANLLTGLTLAGLVQTGITLPIERLFIEQATNRGYRSFVERLKSEGHLKAFGTLYQGAQITLIRHCFVWTTFFVSSHAFSKFFKKIDPENQCPWTSWIAKGILTSTTVVGAGYPLEFIRNRILMEPKVIAGGTFKGVKLLCQRYAFRQLYSGSLIVWIHNNIQTLFLQTFFEKMNKT